MRMRAKTIAELIGLAGVVASLIFVGMQLLLDRELAAAEQYLARAESRVSVLNARLSSTEYLDYRIKRRENIDSPSYWHDEIDRLLNEKKYTDKEFVIIELETQIDLILIDNIYHQYRMGLIEEEFWRGARNSLMESLRDPIRRILYTEGSFRRPIHSEIDALIEEIDADLQ